MNEVELIRIIKLLRNVNCLLGKIITFQLENNSNVIIVRKMDMCRLIALSGPKISTMKN